MKVKMADVARYLGISKATVSLAVNKVFFCSQKFLEKNAVP